MNKKQKPMKVVYEQVKVDLKEAEMRVQKAFAVLFEEMERIERMKWNKRTTEQKEINKKPKEI